MDTRFEYCRK